MLHVAWLFRLWILFYVLLRFCVQAIVVFQSVVVVSYFYSVIVTLVSACVYCLFLYWRCFVNLGMASDYSFLILSFYNFIFMESCLICKLPLDNSCM